MSRLTARALVVTCAAALAGASGGGASTQSNFPLQLSTQKLAPLKGSRYELWVIEGQRKLSAGTFNVTPSGKLVTTNGRAATFAASVDPAAADAIAVTVEPSPDPSRAPTPIVALVGKPAGDTAKLRFPIDLSRLSGSFLLATPTNGENTSETAGVWFLRVAAGMKMLPSLNLPQLPAAGWAWEGWGVTQRTPLTSGRFRSARGADLAAPFSGPKAGPPFPGEDFLRKLPAPVRAPVDLSDGNSMIVLTIEPDLRGKDPTGPAPFSIKPLIATVASGAPDHASLRLRRDLSTVPTATATF